MPVEPAFEDVFSQPVQGSFLAIGGILEALFGGALHAQRELRVFFGLWHFPTIRTAVRLRNVGFVVLCSAVVQCSALLFERLTEARRIPCSWRHRLPLKYGREDDGENRKIPTILKKPVTTQTTRSPRCHAGDLGAGVRRTG